MVKIKKKKFWKSHGGLWIKVRMTGVFQFLDTQEDEELRTHLNIFHEHKEEDLEEFSHRYDNIRMELEYPCLGLF